MNILKLTTLNFIIVFLMQLLAGSLVGLVFAFMFIPLFQNGILLLTYGLPLILYSLVPIAILLIRYQSLKWLSTTLLLIMSGAAISNFLFFGGLIRIHHLFDPYMFINLGIMILVYIPVTFAIANIFDFVPSEKNKKLITKLGLAAIIAAPIILIALAFFRKSLTAGNQEKSLDFKEIIITAIFLALFTLGAFVASTFYVINFMY